jgi:hypothetical protein
MPKENSPEGSPRANFSKADGHSWWRDPKNTGGVKEKAPSTESSVPLASLVEQILRDSGLNAGAPPGASVKSADQVPSPRSAEVPAVPSKLIEELTAAQNLVRTEPLQATAVPPSQDPAADRGPPAAGGPAPIPSASGLGRAASSIHAFLKPHATSAFHALRQFSRRMRPRDWRRRYLTLLSFIHERIFDRRIERLLFFKTPVRGRYSVAGDNGQKTFLYQGPIPGKLLDWALSGLPADLRRYAFADFRAGNGRTLLLASRRNFEHATGYAYDSESCEVLEMNLAQYSRSYMSCRDVRALRAGRDGIVIPSQPAVLFFSDSLAPAQLDATLAQIVESLIVDPRPVYLIFENSGRERGIERMRMFEKVPLPILNRVKAYLFSPAPVSVYKSINSGSGS